MKKLKYIALIAIAAFTSCDEDYLDINTDPTRPTEIDPSLTLPVGQVYSAEYIFYDGRGRHANTLGNLMSYNWSQADGYNWYYSEFQYQINNSFYDQIWEDAYNEPMRNYQVLLNLEGEEYANYKAMAKIMLAYHFQMLVDVYGDIPYTEALQRSIIVQPKFDEAEEVYRGLMDDLTEAVDMINDADADAIDPGQYDLMFNGDMQQWVRFANTLKLRMIVRVSEASGFEGDISESMNEIVANGAGFISENASVSPPYLNEENRQNPFWRSFGLTVTGDEQNNYLATSATPYVIERLQDTNDPRIDYIYEEPDGGHLGVPQGLTLYPDDLEAEFVSNLGPGVLKAPEQPAPLLTLAESYFLQAEAVERGIMNGNAQSLYEDGITASFEYLGVDDDASDYYNQPLNLVNYNNSDNKIEAIINQKWIALNSINGFESWMEYNRTGYPEDLPISLLAPSGKRPVRLLYPASEISINGANVPAQADPFNDNIFWAN